MFYCFICHFLFLNVCFICWLWSVDLYFVGLFVLFILDYRVLFMRLCDARKGVFDTCKFLYISKICFYRANLIWRFTNKYIFIFDMLREGISLYAFSCDFNFFLIFYWLSLILCCVLEVCWLCFFCDCCLIYFIKFINDSNLLQSCLQFQINLFHLTKNKRLLV